MARVPNITNEASTNIDGYPVSTNRNQTGSGMRDSNRPSHMSSIARRVMNSPAYIQAHRILSQESNKSWLQRLEMIPYSVSDAASSLFDGIFTSNYEDKQDANYQYCMEQIAVLMADYQSWKNTLPTTQVQQLSDAGINSAITGQGVSASSIPSVGTSTDPSSVRSTNGIDVISTLVDKFMNVSSGMLDWISKFNDISIQNRRFNYDQDASFAQFVKELSNDGIVLPDDINSFADLLNSDDSSWYDTANARAKRLFNEFNEIRNMDAYGSTIIDRTTTGDYRSGNFYSYDKDGKLRTRFGSYLGASIDIDDYSKNISDLQYKLWLYDLEYRAEYAKKKKEWHDENGYTNVEDSELFASELAALDKTTKTYERDKMKIYVDYLKQLKAESDKGNLSSRVQLMDALYELNATSQISDFADEFYQLLNDLVNN